MLNNLQQIPLNLVKKRVIQKTAEATGDLIGNKSCATVEFLKSQKLHHRIIQKRFQMSMIKKYLKKDIYVQKEGRKLLTILD